MPGPVESYYVFSTLLSLLLVVYGLWKRKSNPIYVCTLLQIVKTCMVNLDLDDRASTVMDASNTVLLNRKSINIFVQTTLFVTISNNFNLAGYRKAVFLTLPALIIFSMNYSMSLNLSPEEKESEMSLIGISLNLYLVLAFTLFCYKLANAN
jgi:hypothetical protein